MNNKLLNSIQILKNDISDVKHSDNISDENKERVVAGLKNVIDNSEEVLSKLNKNNSKRIVSDKRQEIHMTSYLYNALEIIAKGTEAYIINEYDDVDDMKKEIQTLMKDFKHPVIITNITNHMSIAEMFPKSEDENNVETRLIGNDNRPWETFELHCNLYLDAMHNESIIFENDDVSTAKIIRYKSTTNKNKYYNQ